MSLSRRKVSLSNTENPAEVAVTSPTVELPPAPVSVRSEAPAPVRQFSDSSLSVAKPNAIQTRPSVPIYSQGMSRQSSSSSVNQLPSSSHGLQESNTFHNQPLVESPIEQEDSIRSSTFVHGSSPICTAAIEESIVFSDADRTFLETPVDGFPTIALQQRWLTSLTGSIPDEHIRLAPASPWS